MQSTAVPATTSSAPLASPGGAGQGGGASIQDLFLQSTDLFTILLILGSIAAVAVIVRCVFEIRQSRILPPATQASLRRLLKEGKLGEVRGFVERDDTFLSRVLRAALNTPSNSSAARREAAEMAASEECANWFRKVEPLNVIGNLGPLLGLAGTVYGMILAFASLGQAGGQANPATLSLGISKALFHTLLGLMLAVPALTCFGFYRSIVDRLCTRAMVVASELVDMLPDGAMNLGAPGDGFTPAAGAGGPGGVGAGAISKGTAAGQAAGVGAGAGGTV